MKLALSPVRDKGLDHGDKSSSCTPTAMAAGASRPHWRGELGRWRRMARSAEAAVGVLRAQAQHSTIDTANARMPNGSNKALQPAWAAGGPAPWLATMVFSRDEQEVRSCWAAWRWGMYWIQPGVFVLLQTVQEPFELTESGQALARGARNCANTEYLDLDMATWLADHSWITAGQVGVWAGWVWVSLSPATLDTSLANLWDS